MERESQPIITDNGDFTPLSNSSGYFRQLQRVCKLLSDCYTNTDNQLTAEAIHVQKFTRQLLNSISALELKYAFANEEARPLLIDITESGFPNHVEFFELETELKNKTSQLRELHSLTILKLALVDELVQGNSHPQEQLNKLSLRMYLESLEEGELFLPFQHGPITPREKSEREDPEVKGWNIAFSCFDFATNRPYLNFLTFDTSTQKAFEPGSAAYEEFLRVLAQEGARAPDVGILAMTLDEALEFVHPKVLKRLCIGPLYSKMLLHDHRPNPQDSREAYFRNLLVEHSNEEDDFVLLLTEEMIFSKRQEQSKTLFSPLGKVREIYAVSESDVECAARRASAIQHYFLMSHNLVQHLNPKDQTLPRDFSRAKKLAIDQKGEVYGL